ncbi:uncharacterized protein MONOS_18236 [Monocercomonoides exilis]|uniref:uncharacterized protein n=1 Tax=Monocercomonoides exilis TaxID=2049356 RepID=UPI00355A6AA3|nr:hypothetical protein MONOS_18236 [Monocercomonoides exilis]
MWRRWDKRGKQEGQKMGRVNGIYLSEGRIRDGEIWGKMLFFKCREREEGSYEAEQREEFLRMARDGGGGGGRREEGTSALALCIGGVEAEVRQEWGDMKGLP